MLITGADQNVYQPIFKRLLHVCQVTVWAARDSTKKLSKEMVKTQNVSIGVLTVHFYSIQDTFTKTKLLHSNTTPSAQQQQQQQATYRLQHNTMESFLETNAIARN